MVKKVFIPQKANNMPVQLPLVPEPMVPYSCKNSKTVFAMCEVDEETVRKHLSVTPFEYVNNLCMIYVNNFLESPELPYMDAGIVFTVKYKDQYGGCYMYEWEDNDVAIATGRIWGYPKKYGAMTLEKKGDYVHGYAERKGVRLIDIEVDLSKPVKDVPKLHTTYPHLNLLTIARPDGPGIFAQMVTARDNSSTCKTLSCLYGEAQVKLQSSDNDPIGDFEPLRVLGGGYSVTDFLASSDNGWAKVIDRLV